MSKEVKYIYITEAVFVFFNILRTGLVKEMSCLIVLRTRHTVWLESISM